MPETLAPEIRTRPIVAASRAEVARLYRERDDANLLYHSLEHTREVAEAADRIATLMGFPPDDHEALLVAAWWHDIGMLNCDGNPRGHELNSAGEASSFLRAQGYPEERVDLVRRLIIATDMASEPGDDLERAMRDADLSGLGRPEYRDRLKQLRKEWAAQGRLHVDDRVQWLEENLAFLQNHTYLTPAAERLYGEQHAVNVDVVKKRLKKRRKKKKKKASKSGKSALQSEKSAQTMVKTTLRNNIDLTAIADGKANIMLSINAVIISLGIPVLAAYIPEYTYLMVPGACLLLTCVLTITYATLATRPVKTTGKTDISTIGSGKTNLFFFGNYHDMPLAEYKRGLEQVLENQEELDSSVMNDLYYLGVALGNKFNRLRTCYAIFLIGMVLSVIAFVVTFYIAGPLSGDVPIPANAIMPPGDSLRY